VSSWITDPTSKRRDRLSIIAEILEIAKDGTLKTQIMYKANLSFVQLNELVGYMLKARLLDKLDVNGKEVYVATEKGMGFLQRHNELQELLSVKSEQSSDSQLIQVKAKNRPEG